MDSLRSLSSPTALVIRGGEPKHIAARHVVPGDIVMIKPGDVVPADIRLFSVANLEIDEALLTGEALPVTKVWRGLMLPRMLLSSSSLVSTIALLVFRGSPFIGSTDDNFDSIRLAISEGRRIFDNIQRFILHLRKQFSNRDRWFLD